MSFQTKVLNQHMKFALFYFSQDIQRQRSYLHYTRESFTCILSWLTAMLRAVQWAVRRNVSFLLQSIKSIVDFLEFFKLLLFCWPFFWPSLLTNLLCFESIWLPFWLNFSTLLYLFIHNNSFIIMEEIMCAHFSHLCVCVCIHCLDEELSWD